MGRARASSARAACARSALRCSARRRARPGRASARATARWAPKGTALARRATARWGGPRLRRQRRRARRRSPRRRAPRSSGACASLCLQQRGAAFGAPRAARGGDLAVLRRRFAGGEQPLQQRTRAALRERLVEVAALRRLHAGRAAALARALGDQRVRVAAELVEALVGGARDADTAG